MPAKNALAQYGEMKPTPRNALLGYVADALGSANAFATQPSASKPGASERPALNLLAELAGLNSLAVTANRLSYGDPLTNAKKANVPFLKPETADALMMAPLSPRTALAVLSGGMADTGMMKAATVWHGSRDPSWIDRGEKFFDGNPANMPSKYMWVTPKREVAENYAGVSEMARWKADNGIGPSPAPTAGVRRLDLENGANVLKVKDVQKAAAELGTQWGGTSPLEDLLDAARSRGYDAVQMVMDGGNIAVLNPGRLKPLPMRR